MLQNILNFVAFYTVAFWIVIFCILPIGIKGEENPEKGHDHGAPAPFSIKKKFLITALVSLAITSAYFLLRYFGIIDWNNI